MFPLAASETDTLFSRVAVYLSFEMGWLAKLKSSNGVLLWVVRLSCYNILLWNGVDAYLFVVMERPRPHYEVQ